MSSQNLSWAQLMAASEEVLQKSPRWMWEHDNAKALKDDQDHKRGTLILSPHTANQNVGAVLGWPMKFASTGDIFKKDDKEYRVHVDENLRDAVDKEGNSVTGYWIDYIEPISPRPIPPLKIKSTLDITYSKFFPYKLS